MEDRIVDEMKKNKELLSFFTEDDLNVFLQILVSSDGDTKKLDSFTTFIKGEKNEDTVFGN